MTNAYAEALLQTELSTVGAASSGTRSATLNAAAKRLGRLVQKGFLDREVVEQKLVHAGIKAGAAFVSQTVVSGLQAGISEAATESECRCAEAGHPIPGCPMHDTYGGMGGRAGSYSAPEFFGDTPIKVVSVAGGSGGAATSNDWDLGDDCDGDLDEQVDIAAANAAPVLTEMPEPIDVWRNARVAEDGALSDFAKADVIKAFNDLAFAVNRTATQHGWWDEGQPGQTVGEKFMLIVSEIAEALESDRNHEPSLWFSYLHNNGKMTTPNHSLANKSNDSNGVLGKPEGACAELADAIIRILDWCAEKHWPIVEAILFKHAYNGTRSHRHGGKAY